MNKPGIYIHIPFCLKKCNYCDFYSFSGSHSDMEEYTSAVKRQLASLSSAASDRRFDSIYFGGGTPSVLPPRMLCSILDEVVKLYHISPESEITMEANPATVDRSSLLLYRASGINRISFGVQTKEERTLQKIGRLHTFGEAEKSILEAKEAGFDNLSADLIYGLPLQTKEEVLSSISELVSLGITHLSLYGLKIEPNTPFGKDKTLTLPDDDLQCETYLEAVALLQNLGFMQYEISNFALPGYESRHNLKYWTREEYLGFGPAAHSFFNGFRFSFPRNVKKYLSADDYSIFSDVYEDRHAVSQNEKNEEEIMLSLRLSRGIEKSRLEELSNSREKLYSFIGQLEKSGLCRIDKQFLSLTPTGMLVSNSIISDLFLNMKTAD